MIEVKSLLSRGELQKALRALHSEMFHNWSVGSKKNPWKVEQRPLMGKRANSESSEPCFMAWQFKEAESSTALAWFLNYLFQEVNRKIVSAEVKTNIDLSKGERAYPFLFRFDGGQSLKVTRPAGLSKNECFFAEPSFWQ